MKIVLSVILSTYIQENGFERLILCESHLLGPFLSSIIEVFFPSKTRSLPFYPVILDSHSIINKSLFM